MQYLFPVFVGPSSKTWPRCEPQRAQVISVRVIPWDESVCVSTAPGSAWSNDGQPVPESNFASDEKSGLPHALHSYVPSAFSWTYSPEKGASVPFSRRTSYSSGVSTFLNPSSFSGNGFCAIPELYQSYPCRRERERSISVSACLRSRTEVGVISKYSSSAITSSPRSIVSSNAGMRLIASSAPRERMLVSCLPLVGLTIISSPFDVLPITMPSYTSTAGPMYKTPRSCRFQSEKPSALPAAIDIIEPTCLRLISPACGLNPTTREERMPSPLVSSTNWLR